ncbi:MAG: SIMPL domain-containing protein [Pseudomonadota bacterium]
MLNQKTLTTFIESKKINPQTLMIIAAAIALFCVAFAAICFGISSLKSMDQEVSTSITVAGEGEVNMIPDVATISATIRQFSPVVSDAQNLIDVKNKAIEAALGQYGIDDKDIRSLSYSTKPKYALRDDAVECQTPPCKSKYKIIGYEAIQTIQIKAHKVGAAGEIVNELSKIGVVDIAGPSFSVNDSEKLKSQARAAAIKSSRNKAKSIAKDLGVKLGGVIRFEEGGSAADTAAASGEEMIKARVNITYSLD